MNNNPDATNSSTQTGNGRRRGDGRGGRGCGRQGRGYNQRQQNKTTFIGREPTLKHDTFDYQDNHQAQKYRDNIEALKIYVGR